VRVAVGLGVGVLVLVAVGVLVGDTVFRPASMVVMLIRFEAKV
jgi:hypothetical protein